jgi:protein associated with RNAse G/E
MKKMVLALAASSVIAFAGDTTINATMSLMTQGMNQVQAGFLYSNRTDVENGIKVMKDANAIFSKVDVASFIPHNNKTQVTKNISGNLTQNLQKLSDAVEKRNMSDATKAYGEVTANCIACHQIIRGW